MPQNFFSALIKAIKEEKPDVARLNKLKIQFAGRFKLKRIPSNFNVLLNASDSDFKRIKKYLLTKPTRTLSGVSVVAIMAKPRACPHGKCITCPGGPKSVFGDVPQSYTGNEPAAMRAIRNKFDAYLQVFNRLEQYIVLGHPVEKIEMIIMGGTFPAYPKEYQERFVMRAIQALNDFSELFFSKGELRLHAFKEFFELPGRMEDEQRVQRVQAKIRKQKKASELIKEQKRNETANSRLVALAIETRPDYCKASHIKQMLRFGCTRVELGVQSLEEKVLKKMERGHGVQEVVEATSLLRQAFLKVGYHIMPGLPGSSLSRDLKTFRTLFADKRFRPDFLKIYPCLVIKGTKLYDLWKAGEYKPLDIKSTMSLLRKAKKLVPEYTRIMRIQRDIPEFVIEAGPKLSNLRQILHSRKLLCRCIRCREYGTKLKKGVKPLLSRKGIKTLVYEASEGSEYFISAIDPVTDTLFGFCRLRIGPSLDAGIRELHVYGASIGLGKKGKLQHTGIGQELIAMAERFARVEGAHKLKIISGIGVREYYRKLGYELKGYYMVKAL